MYKLLIKKQKVENDKIINYYDWFLFWSIQVFSADESLVLESVLV